MKVLLIGVAGAGGALARYGIGIAVGNRSFPWATLGINLTGSFLLGLVLALGLERGWSEATTLPIAIGFLGAYTTFSTFSYETFALARSDRAALAGLYVVISMIGGVLAAYAGYSLARRIG